MAMPAPLTEGPLPLSDELAAVFRLCGALGRLRPAVLAELVSEAQEVSLSHLDAIERERGLVLPFDVVTVAVLRMPALVRATGLHVAQLGAPVRDCAGEFGAPRGWWAIASFGERAMAEDVDFRNRGCDTLLCISRKATREGDPAVRVVEAGSATAPSSLSAFIRDRLSRRYGRTTQWMAAVQAAAAEPVDGRFVVRVVDDRPRASPVQRLRHPKFGVGTVVRTDGDKVELAFESGERRTLMRKFLSEI